MKIAIDCAYSEDGPDAWASVGAVLFEGWQDEEASDELQITVAKVQPYSPGSFYKRELPCLLEILNQVELRTGRLPDTILVDGHVWLDEQRKPGLGAHLHAALDGSAAVIGVAKSAYRGSSVAIPVHRGQSQRPLFITAVDIPAEDAAAAIGQMAGEHRFPTLLKRADSLAREPFRLGG